MRFVVLKFSKMSRLLILIHRCVNRVFRTFTVVSIPFLLIGGGACVFGVLGNLCVLGAVVVQKALKNSRSVFLVNLAIADLVVTSIADPFAVVGKLILLLCIE